MAAVPAFRREQTNDPALSRVQDFITLARTWLANISFLDGKLIGPVSINAADTTIVHALGRSPRGVIVVDLRGDARVWRPTNQPADASLRMLMRASAQVTATLWVW